MVAGLPTHHLSPAWVPDSHPTFPLPVEYLHGYSKSVLLPSFLFGKLPGLETGLPSPCYVVVHARCLPQKSLSRPSHRPPRGTSTLPLTPWDSWCPSPRCSPQKHVLPHHPGDPFQCGLSGSLSYPQVVVAAITCQPKIQPLNWEAEAPASGPPHPHPSSLHKLCSSRSQKVQVAYKGISFLSVSLLEKSLGSPKPLPASHDQSFPPRTQGRVSLPTFPGEGTAMLTATAPG